MKLEPLDRVDNGDGTVTWKTAMDPRCRSHMGLTPNDAFGIKWPSDPIPDLIFERPRCTPFLKP